MATSAEDLLKQVKSLPREEQRRFREMLEKGNGRGRQDCAAPDAATAHERGWTDAKNRRRCELVDKEIAGTLSPDERTELEDLQSQMLAYRRQVAPLPIEDLRQLHQQLLNQAGNQTK